MNIKVTRYNKTKGNSALIGSFSIVVPKWGNFFINNMKHFEKNGHYFIAFPDKEYEEEGKKKHFPYNGFTERKISDAFQNEVLKAIEQYFLEAAKASALNSK
jgi:hypothetical protein